MHEPRSSFVTKPEWIFLPSFLWDGQFFFFFWTDTNFWLQNISFCAPYPRSGLELMNECTSELENNLRDGPPGSHEKGHFIETVFSPHSSFCTKKQKKLECLFFSSSFHTNFSSRPIFIRPICDCLVGSSHAQPAWEVLFAIACHFWCVDYQLSTLTLLGLWKGDQHCPGCLYVFEKCTKITRNTSSEGPQAVRYWTNYTNLMFSWISFELCQSVYCYDDELRNRHGTVRKSNQCERVHRFLSSTSSTYFSHSTFPIIHDFLKRSKSIGENRENGVFWQLLRPGTSFIGSSH